MGGETGTIIKIVISAIGGNASKKRVALGNLLFNIFITAIAFVLLKPILLLITDIMKIKDPLLGLVAFSTLINLLAIVVFLPVLDSFTKFLERFFKNTDGSVAVFIKHASIEEPETALDLFQRETKYFIHNSMLYNLELFGINTVSLKENSIFKDINERKKYHQKTGEEKYQFLKELQGELHVFYLKLRTKLQDNKQVELNQMISAVRSSMHAVKSVKDIGTNILDLKNSSKDIKYNFFLHHKKEIENLYLQLNAILLQDKKTNFEELQNIFNTIQSNYSSALNNFYTEVQKTAIEDIDITTVINFNRELFTSNKAILMAIKEIVLDEKLANDFNEIPIYKT